MQALARATTETPLCGDLDAAELARVEARLRRAITFERPWSKLVVDFGCDAATRTVHDLFFEDGSGHGGTLRIAWFRREDEGVRVRRIVSNHYAWPGVSVGAWVEAGEIPVAAVEHARVALVARPHVITLREWGNAIGSWTVSFSSNDFHLRLTVVDVVGGETDRRFTGYESSIEQEKYLPMRLAAEPIEALLAAAKLAPVETTDADRQLFTARFLVTMADDPEWWVKERYVADAAALGTVDAVPALVERLEPPQRKGASEERTRDAALQSIAAITGWNARAELPATATTEEVAARVRTECSPPSSAAKG